MAAAAMLARITAPEWLRSNYRRRKRQARGLEMAPKVQGFRGTAPKAKMRNLRPPFGSTYAYA